MFREKKPKVGLVLGSGAARGLAHIGVIKVLERNNIPIDFIAGSSIGAMIGGLYSVTKDISYVEEIALNTNWKEMMRMIDPAFGDGFISGDKVKDFIKKSLKHSSFEDLKIPFSAVATDIVEGKPVVFREGDLAGAIRASIGMPFVFHTLKQDGKVFCDGALSMPIPVSVAREMGAEYIIAVDLDSDYFRQERKNINTNMIELGHDLTMLISTHLAKEEMVGAEVVVVPKVSDVRWNAFFSRERTAEIIARGEKAMEEMLPKLFEKKKEETPMEKIKEFFSTKIC